MEKKENKELTALVDRLKVCSELKYPERRWTLHFYNTVCEQWADKLFQLEHRVKDFEKEMGIYTPNK